MESKVSYSFYEVLNELNKPKVKKGKAPDLWKRFYQLVAEKNKVVNDQEYEYYTVKEEGINSMRKLKRILQLYYWKNRSKKKLGFMGFQKLDH